MSGAGGHAPGDILSRVFDKPLAIMSTSFLPRRSRNPAEQPGHRRYITTPKGEIAGRVLLVDDLADSGKTLAAVIHQLKNNYANHRAAQRRHLDESAFHLYARLLGRILADQSLDHQPFEGYDAMRPISIDRKVERVSHPVTTLIHPPMAPDGFAAPQPKGVQGIDGVLSQRGGDA